MVAFEKEELGPEVSPRSVALIALFLHDTESPAKLSRDWCLMTNTKKSSEAVAEGYECFMLYISCKFFVKAALYCMIESCLAIKWESSPIQGWGGP